MTEDSLFRNHDVVRHCLYCGDEIVWMPQHGGWTSVLGTTLELDDCWCPDADPLLILGRPTETGYMKHIPVK